MDRSHLWLNVFGQTEELIRRLNRARIAKQRVEILNPTSTNVIARRCCSHDSNTIRSIPVKRQSDFIYAGDMEVIGIDEAQFLIMRWLRFAQSLPTVEYVLLWPAWIWIFRANHLVPFLS